MRGFGPPGERLRAASAVAAREGQELPYPQARLAQLSKETGLDYRCVQIKWQRTLWGSCSSKRRINLSARLIFLPPELVRYVLVHELCHTKHCNHSARFWGLVAVFEPAYRDRKGALRQTRSLVPGFLEG